MKKLILLLLFTAIAFWLLYEKELFILGFVTFAFLIPAIKALKNERMV
jgi:hypothetical protein